MKTFLTFLHSAWRFSRSIHSIPEADNVKFWTAEDAHYLDTVLQSNTGQKLLMRLNNYAYKSALAAVRQKGSEAYECGEAAGIQLGITALQAHTISQVAANSHKSEPAEPEEIPADLASVIS